MSAFGLVSATFRAAPPETVISLAGQAGLRCIEWAGDSHVPLHDFKNAHWVGELTRRAGLSVCSYGSYYRLCQNQDFLPVLDAAQALGAPNIRVWAGDRAPSQASDAYYAQAAHELSHICNLAAEKQRSVSLEYHRWTLSQTSEGLLRLLAAANCPNLFTYWQPNPELTVAENQAELQCVSPHLSCIHVFHWAPDNTRLPLSVGAEAWKGYLTASGKGRTLLLEFVANDTVEQFLSDATTLKSWEESL